MQESSPSGTRWTFLFFFFFLYKYIFSYFLCVYFSAWRKLTKNKRHFIRSFVQWRNWRSHHTTCMVLYEWKKLDDILKSEKRTQNEAVESHRTDETNRFWFFLRLGYAAFKAHCCFLCFFASVLITKMYARAYFKIQLISFMPFTHTIANKWHYIFALGRATHHSSVIALLLLCIRSIVLNCV